MQLGDQPHLDNEATEKQSKNKQASKQALDKEFLFCKVTQETCVPIVTHGMTMTLLRIVESAVDIK
ncbi:CLUMA_CG003226, isoform A [Clunio marinus]|uniref:CLUMA_CG003226, isoform A n=1 Tax=Clunio marinus TaxID=568069 RepID=A0A1J1HPN5_9DIPT|nr:CLUMA_CG003226, isoform A [Clunio marinus]